MNIKFTGMIGMVIAILGMLAATLMIILGWQSGTDALWIAGGGIIEGAVTTLVGYVFGSTTNTTDTTSSTLRSMVKKIKYGGLIKMADSNTTTTGVNLGHNYYRTVGEATDENRTYVYPKSGTRDCIIKVSADNVIIYNGANGQVQTYDKGGKKFDAFMAFLNALEAGLYKSPNWWESLAAGYYHWVLGGKLAKKWSTKLDIYARYSPLTWLPK